MRPSEALNILVRAVEHAAKDKQRRLPEENAIGKIDGMTVEISPEDICANIRANGGFIYVGYIQDFNARNNDGEFDMLQGYCLKEVKLCKR
ncbi:MAG: hypothetical protein AB9866_21500 [Syntrophobacteraceae bacterium]